jgi:hypothetical protein
MAAVTSNLLTILALCSSAERPRIQVFHSVDNVIGNIAPSGKHMHDLLAPPIGTLSLQGISSNYMQDGTEKPQLLSLATRETRTGTDMLAEDAQVAFSTIAST